MKERGRRLFVCQSCGHESPRWLGRCPQCQEWNTLAETWQSIAPSAAASPRKGGADPQPLSSLPREVGQRIRVPIGEFHRVVGGGLVPGSVLLLGGEPGIGKSTILLQLAAAMATPSSPVLYATGEESLPQIRLRAERLGLTSDHLYLLAETDLQAIQSQMESLAPCLVIVDSIQTVYLEEVGQGAGSLGQLRECTWRLVQAAKSSGQAVLLVGHVTKEGGLAGPKALEHMVDVVLYLEGEPYSSYRVLRATKNRYGSTQEIGVFQMGEKGLEEILNPSATFLAQRAPEAAGSAVVATMEGTRPLLVEVQALTSPTPYGTPRRNVNGLDYNRLLMVVAVLTKRLGLPLAGQDIFVNVVGGLQVEEPAADLGAALAIASSFRERPLPADLVAVGEVGLGGELRGVSDLERRLEEAARLGFRRCLLPRSASLPDRAQEAGLELLPAGTLAEAMRMVGLRRSTSSGLDKSSQPT